MDYEIYVDSDGVLCDLEAYCLNIFGKLPSEFEKKSHFWASVQQHNDNVQKFFRYMPKCVDADELMTFLVSNFKSVKVLTACGYTPKDAAQQKIDYYAEHYPGIECIVVAKSPDKAKYATPTSILIDDRAKSIDPFVAAGGLGILHTSAADTILKLQEYI